MLPISIVNNYHCDNSHKEQWNRRLGKERSVYKVCAMKLFQIMYNYDTNY